MKKVVIIAVFLCAAVFSATAQIELGAFPLGSWLDANYDAVWSFSSDHIVIESPSGERYFTTKGKTIEDFTVSTTTEGVVLSFYCAETRKTYTFVKPLTSADIILRIDRDGYPQYEVTMQERQ